MQDYRAARYGSNTRNDNAKHSSGYNPRLQGPGKGFTGLSEFYVRNSPQGKNMPMGYPSPAFPDYTPEGLAADAKRHGERINKNGQLEPEGLMPPRPTGGSMTPAPSSGAAPVRADTDPFGLPYGPSNPRPGSQASNAEFARTPASGAGPSNPRPGSQASNADFARTPASGAPDNAPPPPSGPYAPPIKVDQENTPANFRQMARDAQIGRSVTTSGTRGLYTPANTVPFAPQTRPVQAADFRRTISSLYGTGTNVTRQPGQPAGGTTVDPATGKTVAMSEYLRNRNEEQASKETPETEEEAPEEESSGGDEE